MTMMIEPGRPLRLERDRDDAEGVLKVVQALSSARTMMSPSAHARTLREFLWFAWEQPRLPKPLVDGKYPYAYPWSAQARAIWQASPQRTGRRGALVIEHTVPRRELLNKITTNADTLDVDGLLAILQNAHTAVVLSKAEDAQVTAAGYSFTSPDPSDVWARYRAAGLDLAGFAPLTTS